MPGRNGQTGPRTDRGPIRDARGRVSGGNPGNRGGSGRPPNELRDLMRGKLSDVLPKIETRVRRVLGARKTSEATKLGVLMEYAAFLARFGLGAAHTQLDSKGDDAPTTIVIQEVRE